MFIDRLPAAHPARQWNSCAPDNRAETARANGGRAAGWILVDDLLTDPGILLGELAVETCPQAMSLLQGQDLSGAEHADDPAYVLARHLLASQFNQAAGALSCPAADQAVVAGQLLLISLGFDGDGSYLAPGNTNQQDRGLAEMLAGTLARYNGGALCRPAGAYGADAALRPPAGWPGYAFAGCSPL